jgi:hypothetical protein
MFQSLHQTLYELMQTESYLSQIVTILLTTLPIKI